MRRADRQHQPTAVVLQRLPKGHGQHSGPQKQYEKAEPKKCEYCGKDYFGQPGQKYCSKQCYKDAAASGKYKRPKNWIKRRDGKIDIEIRVCGKTTERRESVDYYEARGIWHRGWIGQGYAALVTVDGQRLETLPQIKTFFGFRRDSL